MRGRRLNLGEGHDQSDSVWVQSRAELIKTASDAEARLQQLQTQTRVLAEQAEHYKRLADEQFNINASDRKSDAGYRLSALKERVFDWIESLCLAMDLTDHGSRLKVASGVVGEVSRVLARIGLAVEAQQLSEEISAVVYVAFRICVAVPRPTDGLAEYYAEGRSLCERLENEEGHTNPHRRLLADACVRVQFVDPYPDIEYHMDRHGNYREGGTDSAGRAIIERRAMSRGSSLL
jgi:hypothetical protein